MSVDLPQPPRVGKQRETNASKEVPRGGETDNALSGISTLAGRAIVHDKYPSHSWSELTLDHAREEPPVTLLC
jgi:hypothetical protein